MSNVADFTAYKRRKAQQDAFEIVDNALWEIAQQEINNPERTTEEFWDILENAIRTELLKLNESGIEEFKDVTEAEVDRFIEMYRNTNPPPWENK